MTKFVVGIYVFLALDSLVGIVDRNSEFISAGGKVMFVVQVVPQLPQVFYLQMLSGI